MLQVRLSSLTPGSKAYPTLARSVPPVHSDQNHAAGIPPMSTGGVAGRE